MKIKSNSLMLFSLATVLYIGASYTQSYWQYWFSAILLTSLLVGFISPILNLKNIAVTKNLPLKMQVGKLTSVEIEFENTSKKDKRFLNIYDSPLITPKTSHGSSNTSGLFNTGLMEMLKPLDYSMMYFLKILPAKNKVTLKYYFMPSKRGLFQSGSIEISDSSPLGLFSKTRIYNTYQEVLVYPKIINIRGGWINRIANRPTFTQISRIYTPTSMAATTRTLREYVPGDSPRFIHWPSSAKKGTLMVREFEIESQGYVIIVLDASNKYKTDDYFELAVIAAASLLNICHKNNLVARFITQKSAYSGVDNYRDDYWFSQLEVLARVNQVESETIVSLVTKEMRPHLAIKPAVILVASSRNKLQSNDIIHISVAPERDRHANYTITSENDLRLI